MLLFQPAEEGWGGAKKMVDAGVLENVEAIFGLHVTPSYPIGTVASRPGPLTAGSGRFEAVISGKGGHAAIPQQSVDPIIAASNIIVSLQHLVSREADPLDSQVLGTLSIIRICLIPVLALTSSLSLMAHFMIWHLASVWCKVSVNSIEKFDSLSFVSS